MREIVEIINREVESILRKYPMEAVLIWRKSHAVQNTSEDNE